MGAARLHSRGARDHLCTRVGVNGDVRELLQGASRVAGQRHRQSAARTRPGERADDVLRTACGGNTDHAVVFSKGLTCKISLSRLSVVLGVLCGFAERTVAAGDDADHGLVGNTEGRGAFGGIEHAESA